MKAEDARGWVNVALLGVGVLALSKFLRDASEEGTPDYGPLVEGATLSPSEVAGIVQRLRFAFYDAPFTEDEEAAILALLEARNDADVWAIAEAFGTWAPPLQFDRDLFAAVRAFLDPPDIDYLNGGLAAKGITVQF